MAKRKPRVTLASLDRKIDRTTASLDRRIYDLDRRVDGLDRRVDGLDRKVDRTLMLVEDLRGDVQKVAKHLVVMDQKWERRFDNHETRISNLEKHAGSN